MALGQGWRIGFLGTLHMDVFRQRLEEVNVFILIKSKKFEKMSLLFFYDLQEHDANIIITRPTVPYKSRS
jgi:translation factor GUF1, mitochondrial